MKKETEEDNFRLAGWALIMGAILLSLSGISGQVMGILLSMMLLVIGILGLRNRYGEQVGGFGKNILLIGAILGSLTSLIGLVGALVDPYWILIPAGPAVLFICLSLFGVAVLYTRPLSRWNALPLLAGVWYPILFFPEFLSILNGNWIPGDYTHTITMTSTGLIILGCIALCMLGYTLQADASQNTASA
jgi:hypothetical protein